MKCSTNSSVLIYLCFGLLVTITATFSCTSSSESSNSKSSFVLPFPVGKSYSLIQGNNGQWGHQGKTQYAYDFAMGIGTLVVATQRGVIVATEESYEDSNRTAGQENYIFIQHNDSTFSRYYHLTKNGVLVDVGARVSQGQQIGLSGDTGASAGPHLHFDVTTGCPEWGCQSIYVEFVNALENPLKEEKTYGAIKY